MFLYIPCRFFVQNFFAAGNGITNNGQSYHDDDIHIEIPLIPYKAHRCLKYMLQYTKMRIKSTCYFIYEVKEEPEKKLSLTVTELLAR